MVDNKYIDENRIEDIVSQLTLEEKVGMIHGAGLFRTEGVSRLGVPPLKMSDGPMGIRHEFPDNSWVPVGNTDDYVSYLPCNTALACTWNPELAYKEGSVLGSEARGRGKDIVLAPGINIVRSPLCGRNFEYMSEDPYLISRLVVPFIEGVQDNDVAACVKHFAVNNQETERLNVEPILSERALREIYLPAFEASVKEGNTHSIMTAYNKIFGKYCSHSQYLLREILREEWGFDGIVVSDWGAVHDTREAAEAGLDIEMAVTYNFDDYFFANPMIKAVRDGVVKEDVIDEKVRKILKMMFNLKMFSDDRSKGAYNSKGNRDKALDIARESIVLLKNDEKVLPLNEKKIKTIAVIGENANVIQSAGGGSAEIKALYEITPLQGITMTLGGNVKVKYAKGYTHKVEERQAVLDEALELAKACDEVIFVGGLKHTMEDFQLWDNALSSSSGENKIVNIDSEGHDKTDMSLPYEQDKVINELLKVNKNTVVVISTGSPVDMTSWIGNATTVVQTTYNGMEGGVALAEVLFGYVNPSGKLSVTIPRKIEDSPAHSLGEFPGNLEVKYDEDIFVGYRYFSTYKVQPLFPFGYGLSYTDFKYDNLEVTVEENNEDVNVYATFDLCNIGEVAGLEVAQVYITDNECSEKRPSIELKGFEKVHLKAGETKKISIKLDKKSFAFYKENEHSWVIEPGKFTISIGASSEDMKLNKGIELKSEYRF